ncbi:MFS transporter [Caballeronia sp. 15715]|uniref:MFS transporter n=1 Tax=Caballeronia sp. 15715 TaxID=3391030 RepID=UPI0039E576E7
MHTVSASGVAPALEHTIKERDLVYRKIKWRLMPFLFICYFVNYLDRANIGFAKLQFVSDLHFTNAIYGLGAGLFFVGYVIFEIPSNLLMQRIGTRATISRIMFLWGAVSVSMAFVRTPGELYVARFLLGVAEAGFFPGVILYMTYWFPTSRRGRMTSLFMTALTVAGIFGNPLSGLILAKLHGFHGWSGWQMLFILEGLPAVLLGISAWFFLADSPDRVAWLSAREKEIVAWDIASDSALILRREASFLSALVDRKVYVAGFVSSSMFAASVSIALWAPSLIKGLGVHDVGTVGFLTAIPYAASAFGMFFISRSSDKHLERRWHAAIGTTVCGACLIILPFAEGSVVATVVLLSAAAAGLYGAIVVFWTIPPAYLSGAAKAGGIALISSLAAVSGFFAPTLVGAVQASTGSLYIGLAGVGAAAVLGAVVLLAGIPASAIREAQENSEH